MKKKLLVTGGIVAALVLVGYLVLQVFLGGIVKAAVNSIAPKITGTTVTLDGASISPLTGSGTLSGFLIGNPPGWTSDKAFYLGRIHIDVDPFSLLGDHVVINEITIEDPEIVYETKVVASNIGDLMKNIQAATGGSDETKGTQTESESPGMKFEVKKFSLQNAKVTLGVGPSAISIPMLPVEMTDIGTAEGGITANQLAFAIMRSVTANIVSASTRAAGEVGSTMGAAAGDAAKKAGDAIKGLFNK